MLLWKLSPENRGESRKMSESRHKFRPFHKEFAHKVNSHKFASFPSLAFFFLFFFSVNKLYRMQSIPYGTASCLLPWWDYLGSPNNRVQTSNSWKIQQSGLTWDALSPHSQCSIRRLCLAGGLSVGTLICKGTMKGLVNFHPVSNAVKIFSGLQSFCQREVIWHGTAERVGRPSS